MFKEKYDYLNQFAVFISCIMSNIGFLFIESVMLSILRLLSWKSSLQYITSPFLNLQTNQDTKIWENYQNLIFIELLIVAAVHEKIFIVFMLCSLSHMLVTLKVSQLVHPTMSDSERTSYLIKKVLFVTSMLSTVGLLVFFAKHRLLCHDMGKKSSV